MLNSKKDLRYSNPVWGAYAKPSVSHRPLTNDIKVDVAIVGAGISGALMAEELTDAGYEVALLDRRGAGNGSTMATTALLQYEIDQPLSILAKQIGFDKAIRVWRRSKLSIATLAAKTQALNIKCDLESKASLYLSGDVLDADQLLHEQVLRRQAGIYSRFLSRRALKKLFKLRASAALYSLDTFCANPYRLCAQYLRVAIGRGAIFYSPVEVVEVEAAARRVHLHTSGGTEISARYTVFATGYEVIKPLQKQNYRVSSTWAFATGKQKTNVGNLPLVWQASDPYLYMRSTPDGRVICGGADESFKSDDERNALTSMKVRSLQNKMNALAPHLKKDAEFSWAGSFGETPTGLPLIGEIPRIPNCFAVMAFGGNGIAFSQLGAEIIRGLLTGREDPDSRLFRFTG